jgi:hypothetical protein
MLLNWKGEVDLPRLVIKIAEALQIKVSVAKLETPASWHSPAGDAAGKCTKHAE